LPADDDKVLDLAVARAKSRRQAAAERKAGDDLTHHDMAIAWRDAHTVEGHAPVFTAGGFYVPTPSGLWAAQASDQVALQNAEMFGGRKLARTHRDFMSLAAHSAVLCSDDSFFDLAPVGVVSPQGFHRLTAGGAVETVPLSLEQRQAFALPYAPEYEADAPLLRGVLEQAFEGDHADEQIDLWWQAVGAALFGLMPRLQTVLLMLGRERSGKSLLQRVLERIFPAEAVAAVSPASWMHEYHVAALAGKRLNVVGELSDDAPIPAAAFKNVTGQNRIAARHPTHRPFSYVCLAAHIFASNVLPPTTDRSEAFYRRWRVLRFANTVPADRVDPYLFDKIVGGEMPAILGEAFLGAERVVRAGALRITKPHDQVLERWRLAANPVQQFLTDSEWVALDPEAAVHDKPEVYSAYRRWSATTGFRNPFGRNHFLELLDATGATRGVRIHRVGSRELVAGLRLLPRSD
jgi:putative DNA primase/helicase